MLVMYMYMTLYIRRTVEVQNTLYIFNQLPQIKTLNSSRKILLVKSVCSKNSHKGMSRIDEHNRNYDGDKCTNVLCIK